MDNFPGNSHASRIEEIKQESAKPEATSEPKKVEKVVTGKVTQRKKTLGDKFKDMFFNGGGDFAEHLVEKVIKPKARDMAFSIVEQAMDAVKQGFEEAIHGPDSQGRRTRAVNRDAGNSRIAYHNMSSRTTIRRSDDRPPQGAIRRSNQVKEIIVETREDGDLVIEELEAMIDTMGHCTVGDYYTLVDVTPRSTDQEWGWTSLTAARVHRLSPDEFLISMPRPRPIDS